MTDAVAPVTLALAHGPTLTGWASGDPSLPKVFLLHGFPEAAFVWKPLMQATASALHCVAPNLRGYAGSWAPADVESYRAGHLVQDLRGLIERIGAPIDLLVAHDWGGALAWSLAAQYPAQLRRLLIINSPHPATFLRALRGDPAQRAASAYMNFLVRPDAAALLAEDDFRRLWAFFDGAAWLTAAARQQYRDLWSLGLDPALNYYRASPLRPPLTADDAVHRLELPRETVTIAVPTTVLWGERDRALLPCLLDGLGEFVPELDLRRVADASHWLVHERPELVVERMLALTA
jgi:pimeloyl-ACP methyl ester carboxylesterase